MAKKPKNTQPKEVKPPKENEDIMKREVIVSDYLQTGSTVLDMAISCHVSNLGGIPTRRIIEFSGTGASGKTYISGEIAGSAIRKDYLVYVDDIERRWDLKRLGTFGIENGDKRFKYLEQSKSVEDCFGKLFRTLEKAKSGTKILYIIDPIAALYAEQEKKSDKMSQARAKALQKHFRFLKDLVSYDAKSTNCLVFSNQLIDDPTAGMFGPKQKTPGGNALIHWPSVRVRFDFRGKLIETKNKKGEVKSDETNDEEESKSDTKLVRGIKIHGEVIKNSEDDCFRTCDFSIEYGYGIDNIRDCTRWLKAHTEVLGNGTWMSVPRRKKDKKDWPKVSGVANFIKFIEDNNLEKWLAKLTRKHYRLYHAPKLRKEKVRC